MIGWVVRFQVTGFSSVRCCVWPTEVTISEKNETVALEGYGDVVPRHWQHRLEKLVPVAYLDLRLCKSSKHGVTVQ